MVERFGPLRQAHGSDSWKRPAHGKIIAKDRPGNASAAHLASTVPPTQPKGEHIMKWTRMTICEAVSDDLVKEVVNHMQEHVRDIPGKIGHPVLVEEGGLM